MTSRELGYCGREKGGGGRGVTMQILETSHSAILPILLKGETCLDERISNIFASILFDVRT